MSSKPDINKSMHEDFVRQHEVKVSSEKSFGLVMGGFILIVALWPLLNGQSPRFWAVLASVVFFVLAFAKPSLLAPLNYVWSRFGLLIQKITKPIILLVMYVVTIIPFGIVIRALGKDPLRLRFDSEAPTYWIKRDPVGPKPESLRNQF